MASNVSARQPVWPLASPFGFVSRVIPHVHRHFLHQLLEFDLLLYVLKASLSTASSSNRNRHCSIDFNSFGRCNCCAAWPPFMSGRKNNSEEMAWILSMYYNQN